MTNEYEKLERALVRVGREMEFPATPALSMRVQAELANTIVTRRVERSVRRWARVLVPAAVALLLALALLFALPDARHAVAQFLGLQNLRIFYVTPVPTATPTNRPFTLCCETTLAEARARARFRLLLPPDEIPARGYFQSVYGNGEQVVLVFGDPANPKFTLYQAQRWIYGKLVGGETQTAIQETQVNGTRALWFHNAPHIVMQLDASGEPIYKTERVVDANTLVWETGNAYDGIIYRVETGASLEEAVRFAESLR